MSAFSTLDASYGFDYIQTSIGSVVTAQQQGAQQIPGSPIHIDQFRGAVFSSESSGVVISATASCPSCNAWVQTIRRTGADDYFKREFVDKGYTTSDQEYYPTVRNPIYSGGTLFFDEPTAHKGGSWDAVLWAGHADLKNKTFTPTAAIVYGFKVGKGGQLTLILPRAASAARRAHSLATINADSSPWIAK